MANHNSEVGQAQPNPWPKSIDTGAMRSEANANNSDYPNKPLNLDKMRSEANSNNDQTKHVNQPNPTLNGFDRDAGSIKGGS